MVKIEAISVETSGSQTSSSSVDQYGNQLLEVRGVVITNDGNNLQIDVRDDFSQSGSLESNHVEGVEVENDFRS